MEIHGAFKGELRLRDAALMLQFLLNSANSTCPCLIPAMIFGSAWEGTAHLSVRGNVWRRAQLSNVMQQPS